MNTYTFFSIILLILKGILSAESTSAGALSYRITNCEKEVGFIQERIKNQEDILSSLRHDIQSNLKVTQSAYRSSFESSEERLKKFDESLKKVVQDMKLLKNHTNEAIESINQIKKTIVTLDESQKNGREEIKNLETAVRKLAEMLEKKAILRSSSCTSYIVKSGDTLDKISKDCKVSIQAIKKANNLTSNTIVVGQELEIPHK